MLFLHVLSHGLSLLMYVSALTFLPLRPILHIFATGEYILLRILFLPVHAFLLLGCALPWLHVLPWLRQKLSHHHQMLQLLLQRPARFPDMISIVN